jgi:hypothetical protein
MFEYTISDISNQIGSLPVIMLIWLRTIGIVNMASVFFLHRTQARWVLASILFIMATNVPIFLSFGLVKLGSIPHLFVWVPLVIYLAREIRSGHVDVRKPFGMWCFAVMLIDLVSVVFDVRDGVQYLLGDTLPVTDNLSAGLPIPTLIAILVSVVVISAYALRLPGRGSVPNQRSR